MASRRRKPLPEAVTVIQAAHVLGVHPMTVRRWIRRGIILAYRVGPHLIRIPRSELSRMRTLRIPVVVEGDQPNYPRV